MMILFLTTTGILNEGWLHDMCVGVWSKMRSQGRAIPAPMQKPVVLLGRLGN